MNSKKSTIFLHIGTIKTGTTSLQHFFHINRDTLLENHNIYYPKSPGLKNHTKLPLYAFNKNVEELRIRHNVTSEAELTAFRKNFTIKLQTEIKLHIDNGVDILFSSEHLSSRAVDKSEIEALLQLFQIFDTPIKVIVYLRRQDRMMLSTYSTWVKSGGRWKLNPNAYKNRRYNHLEMLDLWASAIGHKNLIVKVFEKSKMVDGDLFTDFSKVLNINTLESLKIPDESKLNGSLDALQIQFLTLFNKFVPVLEDGKPNRERGDVVKYLEEYTSESKLDISLEEKQTIYQYFEKDNNLIAQQYIKDGRSLFDPIKENDNANNKPLRLSAEKAVEIASHLWMKQQNQLNNKLSFIDKIKKSLKKTFRL